MAGGMQCVYCKAWFSWAGASSELSVKPPVPHRTLFPSLHLADVPNHPALMPLGASGKEFRRDQSVGDRVGHNEKTRVTCKLQKPGSGPPGREPAVSEDERKAMMAYYFKRQEELKRLAEVCADV